MAHILTSLIPQCSESCSQINLGRRVILHWQNDALERFATPCESLSPEGVVLFFTRRRCGTLCPPCTAINGKETDLPIGALARFRTQRSHGSFTECSCSFTGARGYQSREISWPRFFNINRNCPPER